MNSFKKILSSDNPVSRVLHNIQLQKNLQTNIKSQVDSKENYS